MITSVSFALLLSLPKRLFLLSLLKLWPTVRCQLKFCMFLRCKFRFCLFFFFYFSHFYYHLMSYQSSVVVWPHANPLVGCVRLQCCNLATTMEPWYNEGPRDWRNPGTKYVRYDEVSLYRVSIPYILLLLSRGILSLYRGLLYIKVRQSRFHCTSGLCSL